MRSRLYGVLTLCIGSGLVGFVNIGVMAELIGAPNATIVSGIEGLVAMVLTWRWWRQIGGAGRTGAAEPSDERIPVMTADPAGDAGNKGPDQR
jgi:hypothetical protein